MHFGLVIIVIWKEAVDKFWIYASLLRRIQDCGFSKLAPDVVALSSKIAQTD